MTNELKELLNYGVLGIIVFGMFATLIYFAPAAKKWVVESYKLTTTCRVELTKAVDKCTTAIEKQTESGKQTRRLIHEIHNASVKRDAVTDAKVDELAVKIRDENEDT